MRNRKGLIVLGVLLLVGLGIFLWWRSPVSKSAKKEAVARLTPEISIASVNISDIDDDRIKLTSKVQLSNPLPVDINTKRLQ